MLGGKRIAVIGVGTLGEALVSGLLKRGELEPGHVTGSVAHEASLDRVRDRLASFESRQQTVRKAEWDRLDAKYGAAGTEQV